MRGEYTASPMWNRSDRVTTAPGRSSAFTERAPRTAARAGSGRAAPGFRDGLTWRV